MDTMGADFETNNRRTTNAPSIWDRLPYNIGMELHQNSASSLAAKNDDYDCASTSSFNCYEKQQQLVHDTRQLSLLPPPPQSPLTPPAYQNFVGGDDADKKDPSSATSSSSGSRGVGNSQGPARIPLLFNSTHPLNQNQQQKHYLLLPQALNSNDKKIDRNFKNSKSITSIAALLDNDDDDDDDYEHVEQQQQQQQESAPENIETDSLVTSSPSDSRDASVDDDDDDDDSKLLKLIVLTSARLNHVKNEEENDDDNGDGDEDETKDNRRTYTKNFPVDNRISNKKNLVIKFNESQSATTTASSSSSTVRRKPPANRLSCDEAATDDARAAELVASAKGASDRHRDCDDYSDMTATTTTTTRSLGTTTSSTATVTKTSTTMVVGSTSRRLNCCPTASRASSFSSVALAVTTSVIVTLTALPDVLRKFDISSLSLSSSSSSLSMRKDKKTMTAVTALYLILYIFTSAKCMAARQDASNCTFPPRWEGSWFLSGYQQSIHIKGSQFSYRGKCAASDGNKYLIVDEKGCHRCLVIYEKHKNVLQYKESECEGDSMYMHQSNPSAMAMRSILKSDHRGGAHPNLNGHSRLSSSDQYIMRSNDDMNDCPPDFCKGRETLQNLCDQIPGDALLYSLFRENAEPVKCPLKGPFVFTYNRGHGECKSPVSNIESCTEDSRLLLSFQACPDVQGTESTVEELTCLATWKDGNSRYLVGLVSHHHAISNEERYRCFVYEKISSLMGGPGMLSSKDAEYKLAQSGDATCNGLDSAEVGSRIMSLRKPPPAERCDFPVWFKGPRHWHALMGNSVYNYHPNDGSMHIIKPNGYMETRALCEQINKQTATEMMAVVHYTTGCQSGFMCMIFYRRDTHVIEIQTGKQASRLEDACAPDHFDINKMPYITLLASNPDPQICPLEGLYHLRGAIGPPYISSRHKRNHNNNKGHTQHGHHHHEVVHKRHTALSLHNAEELGHTSWHSNLRPGQPIRHRREANLPALPSAVEISAEVPPLALASAPLLASAMPPTSSSSSSKSSSSSLLLKSGSPLSVVVVDAIETNDLNQKTHNNDDDDDASTNGHSNDDTTSSLLLKLPPRQLNHDNVQSQRITIATDGSRTNELKKDSHRQQLLQEHHLLHHHDRQQDSVGGSRSNGIGIGSGNTSREVGSISNSMQRNTTTSSGKLLAQRSRRDAPGCIVNYKAQRQLWIGCTGPNLIDVRPQCNEDGDEEYSCHGSWSENGTVYVIARHKGTKHGVCISYRPLEGTAAKLVIGDACYRGVLKPPEHHLVANLTVLGKCGDTSSADSYIVHAPSTSILALFLSLASVFLPIQIMFTNR